MFEDFKPVPQAKPIAISDLTPEEVTRVEQLGLTLQKHEYVTADLAERIKTQQLDADTANQMAMDEITEEDNLANVHPDVAASIRESMRSGPTVTEEQMRMATNQIDEDDHDPPASKPNPGDGTDEERKSFAPPEKDYGDLIAMLTARQEESRRKYQSAVTDDDRTALLNEVITGTPFQRTFSFMGGNLQLALTTISAEHAKQIAARMSREVKGNPMTMDQYKTFQGILKAACQLKTVVAGGHIVYDRRPDHTADDIDKAVYEEGPGKGEFIRRLLAESSRELDGVMNAIMIESSREVFTVPGYEDIG